MEENIFISVLGFLLFTVLVYFFQNFNSKAVEASDKIISEIGFGESNARDWEMVLLICFWAPLSEELLYGGEYSYYNLIMIKDKAKSVLMKQGWNVEAVFGGIKQKINFK